jgi:hypothetical protein
MLARLFRAIRAAGAGSREVRSAEKPDGWLDDSRILSDLVRFLEIEWSR